MKSSGISSARSITSPAAELPRRSFALAGRSVRLDPRTHAVRGDLADLRLAERVFAPHYAAPMAMTLIADAALRDAAASDAETVALLVSGDEFEVLELSGTNAWGVAPAQGLVGYVAAFALGMSA